jgi:hypothetical protein
VTVYIPFGLIAIGLSMYIFYAFRRRQRDAVEQRRSDLKETRQSWLDHQLGVATSDIILYGEFMEQKIARLRCLGTDVKRRETYYVDEESDEKWVKEYVPEDDSMQLRKVGAFGFE